MANEEEIESFEISEQDLYDAFQPGHRRRHRQTKNQQIYGVFNYEEEEDDDGPSSSARKSKKFKSKDISPLSFVKGGVHQVGGTKEDSKQSKPTKLVDASDSSEDENNKSDEDIDPKDQLILDSLKKSSKGKLSSNLNSQKPKPQKQRYFAGTQSKSSGTNLGEWEKHTKGIGAKLLMQMGYEPGKGLGKSLQGRSVPVEANVRKGRGAIGAYGAEHKNEPDKFVVDSEEEEEKEFQRGMAQWRKDGEGPSSTKKKDKIRYAYRTTEEVVEEVNKGGVHKMAREYSEISKVKVIDMTGREQRVLSGYSALAAKRTTEPDTEVSENTLPAKDKLQLDKLAYNLDALVDFCEHEIIHNAKELSHNHDRITALEGEIKTLTAIVSKEEKQLSSLKSVLEVLDEVEARRAANTLEFDFLLEQFSYLQRHYSDDYVACEMANIALTYLIPLLKSRLAAIWRPLESGGLSDESCRRLLLPWRPLLEFQTRTTRANTIEPYDGLLWHGWMPALRGLIGQWRCKEAEPMVDLLDRWEPLLPEWIMENILDQLILPRIQSEVDAWNPLTDLIPIHAWIHPWLPRLSARLELVYPTIRQKMAQALVAWEPCDQSARSVLMPWVPVFSKGAMDAFLTKNILPKLQEALLSWTMEANPNQQNWEVWKWVMNWKDLMPLASLVTMLEKSFFPRWLQVLVSQLNQISPNYEEIAIWYNTWKSYFPTELASHPAIKEQFTRALDLMNRSLAAGGQVAAVPPPMPPPPPILTPILTPIPPPVAVLAEPIPQSFRELVEYRCAQQGILFLPLVNRWQAGRPVFRVGNVLSYFDRQIAFVMGPNGLWMPVTVQQLMDMAIA